MSRGLAGCRPPQAKKRGRQGPFSVMPMEPEAVPGPPPLFPAFPSAPCGKINAMGKHEKLLLSIISGTSDSNIRFSDLRGVLKNFGFDEKIKGGHYIFSKSGVDEIINLQPLADGNAKPYQVKQVRNIMLKYRLHEGA